MSNFAIIFCVLLHFQSVIPIEKVDGTNNNDDELPEEPTQSPKSCTPKYNAVLFLADPSDGGSHPIKRSIDVAYDEDFFKLGEKCRVKHCTSSLESKIGDSVDSVLRFNRGTCKCDELLKTSLLSLINYARDTLGMTTAMVSVTNNSFSSDIRFRNAETHVEKHTPDNTDDAQDDDTLEEPPSPPPLLMTAKNVSVRDDTMPRLVRASSGGDVFPIFELFNPERRIEFNDISGRHKTEKRSKLDVVTGPEHTEVFKIRSKRGAHKIPAHVKDVPVYKEEKPKSLWDILNVMENIRLSFFNNILDDEAEKLQDESVDMGAIGSVSEISIFDIVKKTLIAVTSKNDTAFLMVVIGGRLKDKCDPYSPLMQSIKYVIENTNEENTLIVLTGFCPKQQNTNQLQIGEAGNGDNGKEHKQIPVYARGCKNKVFEESRELYDVPEAIHKFLAEKNGRSAENSGVDTVNGIKAGGREKADLPLNRRNKRNSLNRPNKMKRSDQEQCNASDVRQVIATYATVAVIFIFCF